MLSHELKINSSSYKKVKNYIISYTKQDYFGINQHGEIRRGYYINNDNTTKLIMLRIVPLPLTSALQLFLQQQITYSDLCSSVRTVYNRSNTNLHQYISMQYFPKTFQSQLQNFMKNKNYLHLMVNKFLKIYSIFFNLGIPHGNLKSSNIAITFNEEIKLMDFEIIRNQDKNNAYSRDFDQFQFFIAQVMENNNNQYPACFQSFNHPDNRNWNHLFANWHVISPLEALYITRKYPIDNIVALLQKLHLSLQAEELQNNQIKIGIRLLQIATLSKSKDDVHKHEKKSLQRLIDDLQTINIDYYNSIIMSVIKDPDYYGINISQRLILIAALIPDLNHEYLYYDILNQMKNQQQTIRNQILGNSLILKYWAQLNNNLLKKIITRKKYLQK